MSLLQERQPRLTSFGLSKPGDQKVKVEVVDLRAKAVIRKGEVPKKEFFSGDFNPLSVPSVEGGQDDSKKGLA